MYRQSIQTVRDGSKQIVTDDIRVGLSVIRTICIHYTLCTCVQVSLVMEATVAISVTVPQVFVIKEEDQFTIGRDQQPSDADVNLYCIYTVYQWLYWTVSEQLDCMERISQELYTVHLLLLKNVSTVL